MLPALAEVREAPIMALCYPIFLLRAVRNLSRFTSVHVIRALLKLSPS